MCMAETIHGIHKKVTRPFGEHTAVGKIMSPMWKLEDKGIEESARLERKNGYENLAYHPRTPQAPKAKLVGYGQTGGRAGLQVGDNG